MAPPNFCSIFFLGLLVLTVLAVAAPPPQTATDSIGSDEFQDLPVEEHFEQWMVLHERSYKDEFEKEKRFNIFKQNKEYVESFNKAGNRTFTLGINAFSDMTDQEFADTYLSNNCSGQPPSPPRSRRRRPGIRHKASLQQDSSPIHNVSLDYIPAEIDWVKLGAVTSVKTQGKCGCCWAFAAVVALEGLNKIHYKTLLDLSEQHLIDCDTNSHGCDGGGIKRAFAYAAGNDGIAKEEAYPFVGRKGTCREDAVEPFGSIEGYKSVPKNDAWALQRVVAQQPAAAVVTYGPDYVPEFKNYRGGLYHPGRGGYCGAGFRHAVGVVGYHTNPNYWILKNSWGSWWGEGGYMRLARDPSIIGPCGILMQASYPFPWSID